MYKKSIHATDIGMQLMCKQQVIKKIQYVKTARKQKVTFRYNNYINNKISEGRIRNLSQ